VVVKDIAAVSLLDIYCLYVLGCYCACVKAALTSIMEKRYININERIIRDVTSQENCLVGVVSTFQRLNDCNSVQDVTRKNVRICIIGFSKQDWNH